MVNKHFEITYEEESAYLCGHCQIALDEVYECKTLFKELMAIIQDKTNFENILNEWKELNANYLRSL